MIKTIPIVLFVLLLAVVLRMDAGYKKHHRSQPHESLMENGEAHQLWDYMRLRDPATGAIPRGIHSRELAFAQTIGTNRSALKGTSTIHTTAWQLAGPINAGGRTQAIGIDVVNEANVLIATAQGGVFRSTDSGQSWTRTTAPGQLKDMSSLVQDHRAGKTGTWYAGTGELISTTWRRTAVYTEPDYHSANIGNGIYKSTDDGLTWNVLPATVSPNPTVLDSVFDGVWNIALDSSRSDSDIVYAAGFGAIMRSNDGGENWTHVLGDPVNISVETDVAITSNGIVYAYLSGQAAGSGTPSKAGIWRSTDGSHWDNISPSDWPSQMGRMKIAIAPSNENIFYIGGVSSTLWYGSNLYKYTYLSGDGSGAGGEWDDRSANVPVPSDSIGSDGLNTYGGYAVTLKVHPTDPNIVFFGGTNLYRSWDGFASPDMVEWIGGYDPNSGGYSEQNNDHPDHHDLMFVSSNPSVAYNANDGGMFMTYDILGYDGDPYPVTWQNINFQDQASILYVVALDHATPGDTTILGGFQDQGSWLSYDSNYWYQWYGGDGCYCAIDDGAANLYMSSQEGNIVSYIVATQSSIQLQAPNSATAQFVAPFILDPTNTNQMYFAADNTLQRNDDLSSGANWNELTNSTLSTNTDITALGMSMVPAHRLYYGTSNGRVYRMDGANGSSPMPHEITGSTFPKNAYVSCIAVDPQNADSIVVCFSNYGVISIFASSNAGTTWHNASGNLEQNADGSGDGPSVRWVSVVHQNGQTLYLCGTSVGLFSTPDISGPNVSWNPEGAETIGHAIVENIDVRQSDGYVAIATQGSGVYTTHVTAAPSSVGVQGTVPSLAFTLSPNPATIGNDRRVVASFVLPGSGQMELSVVDVTGKTVLRAPYGNGFSAGLNNVTMDCSTLPAGSYFVELRVGEATETRRLVIER